MIVPGLVNAHVHLEFPRQHIPAGLGLPAWVMALRDGPQPSREAFEANEAEARRLGTAAVVDISNQGLVGRLPGLYLHEVLGIDAEGVAPARGTPHATYSTSLPLIRACHRRAAEEGRHWSIHVEEDESELDFLRDLSGPWRDYMLALGRDLGKLRPRRMRPIEFLDMAGLLGPRTVLVHCTVAREVDIDLVVKRGAAIVVCPRSNLHISGRLPDVPAMIARGAKLMIGTDSLASTPDLDLVAEVAVLARAFPQIRPSYWLDCITRVPREVLYLDAPDRLEIDAPSLDVLFDGTPWPRRWVS